MREREGAACLSLMGSQLYLAYISMKLGYLGHAACFNISIYLCLCMCARLKGKMGEARSA